MNINMVEHFQQVNQNIIVASLDLSVTRGTELVDENNNVYQVLGVSHPRPNKRDEAIMMLSVDREIVGETFKTI